MLREESQRIAGTETMRRFAQTGAKDPQNQRLAAEQAHRPCKGARH